MTDESAEGYGPDLGPPKRRRLSALSVSTLYYGDNLNSRDKAPLLGLPFLGN
jgi:hypothetical protein